MTGAGRKASPLQNEVSAQPRAFLCLCVTAGESGCVRRSHPRLQTVSHNSPELRKSFRKSQNEPTVIRNLWIQKHTFRGSEFKRQGISNVKELTSAITPESPRAASGAGTGTGGVGLGTRLGVALYKEGASRAGPWAPLPAGPQLLTARPRRGCSRTLVVLMNPSDGSSPSSPPCRLLRTVKRLSKGQEQAGDRASIPSLCPTGLPMPFLFPVNTEPAGSGNMPHRGRGEATGEPPGFLAPAAKRAKGRGPRAARHTLGAAGKRHVTGRIAHWARRSLGQPAKDATKAFKPVWGNRCSKDHGDVADLGQGQLNY